MSFEVLDEFQNSILWIFHAFFKPYVIGSRAEETGEQGGGGDNCPPKLWYTGIPSFRDFTIRDPSYFVILFKASISWFWRKKSQKIFFFLQKFFLDFFLKFLFIVFLFVYSDYHLINVKIYLLGITITRNSISF